MKIKEKLSHFWNVTLGEDYSDKNDIENIQDTNLKNILQNSLKQNISQIENKYYGNTTTSNKQGAGKNKADLVEKVQTNPEAAISKIKQENIKANSDGKERGE